jgi:hypothetical protein
VCVVSGCLGLSRAVSGGRRSVRVSVYIAPLLCTDGLWWPRASASRPQGDVSMDEPFSAEDICVVRVV